VKGESKVAQAKAVESMTIDFLILADAAQVQNGKLYLIGGGWDRLQFHALPAQAKVAVAVGVRVPPSQAGVRHNFRVRGLNSAQDRDLFSVEGEFEVLRPVAMPSNFSQLYQIAMEATLPLEREGAYFLEAILDDGKVSRSIGFFVAVTPS
jgi:hypothetical protein